MALSPSAVSSGPNGNVEGRRCLPTRGGQALVPPPASAGAGLRRIAPYASVAAPRRLASDALPVIRNAPLYK